MEWFLHWWLFLWLLGFSSLEWKTSVLRSIKILDFIFLLFQLFVLSLLYLSAVFWLELLCFCWTSIPLRMQADMKLQLQCFQVRAWIGVWNSDVQFWGFQLEYCDSWYSTRQIKMRCLSWCCINLWHCAPLKLSKPAVSLTSAHKNICSNEVYHCSTAKSGYLPLRLSKIILSFLQEGHFQTKDGSSFFSFTQSFQQKFTPKLKNRFINLLLCFPFPAFVVAAWGFFV